MIFTFDKLDGSEWDAKLLESKYDSPFHAHAWNTMVADSFGNSYQGYIASHGSQSWLIPAFQYDVVTHTSSIGYGGPLPLQEVINGANELQDSMEILSELKEKLGSHAIQGTLYPADFWPQQSQTAVETGETVIVTIDTSAENIFNRILSGNCRTSIRKAEKSGVMVRELTAKDDDAIEQAVTILNETQKQVGSSYMTDLGLLRAIGSLDTTNVVGRTRVAELEGKLIAMSTVIINRSEAVHLFSGWDREYARMCANQALHWHGIQSAQKAGLVRYNMGSSHTAEILTAKLRWGGKETTVPKISL